MVSKILKRSKRQGYFGTKTEHFLKLLTILQSVQSSGQNVGS